MLPLIYLVRHGETTWSRNSRNTGLTDAALTRRGREHARRLKKRLARIEFQHVLTSPLQRVRRTCELAGFGTQALVDPDLVEWDFGRYEGRKTSEIRKRRPGWVLFRDGCPHGEHPDDLVTRADRVADRLRALDGHALVFSSGDFLRALAVRWCGWDLEAACCLPLDDSAVSVLGYGVDRREPVIRLWNDTRHVDT